MSKADATDGDKGLRLRVSLGRDDVLFGVLQGFPSTKDRVRMLLAYAVQGYLLTSARVTQTQHALAQVSAGEGRSDRDRDSGSGQRGVGPPCGDQTPASIQAQSTTAPAAPVAGAGPVREAAPISMEQVKARYAGAGLDRLAIGENPFD